MEEKEFVIVVCSKNQAKNAAVENVIKDYFKNYKIVSLETTSNVSETPIGDEDGILGCRNRIISAIEQYPKANLYIAMEGILTEVSVGTFLCGWSVIYNKDEEEYYYGCSSKVKVPDDIITELTKEQRLSDIVAKHLQKTETEVKNYGTNGMLTNGAYTRTDEFTDSVLCALSTKFNKIVD